MRKLTAWTATSIGVLVFWTGIFLVTEGWQGRLILVVILVAAVTWGLFRLITYKPEHERGAGSLEEVKRLSRLRALDDPPPACPPDREEEEGRAMGESSAER